ncbi:crotonase/enoyl-CoA hydratase family protein [Pseudonocardia sp. McavD-2-B]|uniref:crotonase/enoyl-CoA hydratase family protein n=1 Tax=Pseudonocardia sp. McavD-2-B TaxID=2954499 RepID=UPI00209722F9|nr:crotonase/enoyl-CoA hydratase family protein [Pseudonocardia sp. McavD-2-B]MCO7191499.1 crotonase/enoyl-CoA hydratase family protein [Pseudonocardia sp. McavD-2-B]
MTDGEVLVERRGSVLLVALDRPRQRNAMTLDAARVIAGAMSDLDADDSLSVAVLTGNGGHFCAGMDLKRFVDSGERPFVPGRGFGGLVETPPIKPVVAAVEGFALGGGFEMALACDLVVASETARFALPEVRRGLVARGGGMFRLPRALPRAIAMELLLTGTMLEPAVALQYGLVNRVAAENAALDTALDLANAIAANAPLAVATSARIARAAYDRSESSMFEWQQQWTDAVFDSADAAEGSRAFTERRDPVWTGR